MCDKIEGDLDPRGRNAQTLSGPEGSSNTGCLRSAWTPGPFFLGTANGSSCLPFCHPLNKIRQEVVGISLLDNLSWYQGNSNVG